MGATETTMVTITNEEVDIITGITERDASKRPSRCTLSHHHTHTSLKIEKDYADKCEKTKSGAQEAPPTVDFGAAYVYECALRKQVTSIATPTSAPSTIPSTVLDLFTLHIKDIFPRVFICVSRL